MSSPNSPEWFRNIYTDVTASGVVGTGTGGVTAAVAVPSANHTIHVQKITINIQTSAAQSITVRDQAGTPVNVLVIEASAAAGAIRTIDFGAKGFACTLGKSLDIAGTAGPAYAYVIEAYAIQAAAIQGTTVDRLFA